MTTQKGKVPQTNHQYSRKIPNSFLKKFSSPSPHQPLNMRVFFQSDHLPIPLGCSTDGNPGASDIPSSAFCTMKGCMSFAQGDDYDFNSLSGSQATETLGLQSTVKLESNKNLTIKETMCQDLHPHSSGGDLFLPILQKSANELNQPNQSHINFKNHQNCEVSLHNFLLILLCHSLYIYICHWLVSSVYDIFAYYYSMVINYSALNLPNRSTTTSSQQPSSPSTLVMV